MGKWEYTKRHLVRVSLHHAGAHVLNVRADRADASKLLALAEPQINLHVTLLGLRDIEVDVLSAESELRLAGVYRSTGALKSAVYTNRALSALCVHPGTCTWRLAPCVYIPVHAQGA